MASVLLSNDPAGTARRNDPPPRASLARLLETPKAQLLVVFALLAAVALPNEGIVPAGSRLMLAALAAVAVDLPFVLRAARGWRFPTSALLSGVIVGMVLDTNTPFVVVAGASALAILSKRLLRTPREHVFNPAALALLLAALAFGSGESWWGALGNLPTPFAVVLVVLGSVLVDRMNKFPLVLSFGAVYFALLTALAFVNPGLVAEQFRDPFVQAALFFALFMLTDPPTSPNRYLEQVVYGSLAATTAGAAQVFGAGQVYLLIGVLAANAWLAVHRWANRRWVQTGALAT
ncbi:MAG: hypothetical protein HYX52_08685 [Chloroflexi bacterium]|nr:hypothetical protein [Chloroflexota bacterium]